MEVVRRAFRPEFLNRLDEIILFHRLGRKDMKGIVEIQLERLQQAARRPQDRRSSSTTRPRPGSANTGYDPVYGARPLKRVIQRELQDPLALRILEGRIGEGATARVDVGDGRLAIDGDQVALAA